MLIVDGLQSTVNRQQSRLRLRSALTLSEVVPLRGSKLRVAATIGEGSTVFYGIFFYLEVPYRSDLTAPLYFVLMTVMMTSVLTLTLSKCITKD